MRSPMLFIRANEVDRQMIARIQNRYGLSMSDAIRHALKVCCLNLDEGRELRVTEMMEMATKTPPKRISKKSAQSA